MLEATAQRSYGLARLILCGHTDHDARSQPPGGSRARWRRDSSKPRRLPLCRTHNPRCRRRGTWKLPNTRLTVAGEPLPLSAKEQTHAQRSEGKSGWRSSQRTTRSTWSSVWKKMPRGSARGWANGSSKTRARVKRRRRAMGCHGGRRMECHQDRTRRTRTINVANVTDSRCTKQR